MSDIVDTSSCTDLALECSSFDFKNNEVLTVEKIILATFNRINRAKYPMKWIEQGKKFHEQNNPEYFINRIGTNLPNSKLLFDSAKVQLLDTTSLEESIDRVTWITNLQNSSWFGPYYDEDYPFLFEFHSASLEGLFDGLVLGINFDSQVIMLGYQNNEGDFVGAPYCFPENNCEYEEGDSDS